MSLLPYLWAGFQRQHARGVVNLAMLALAFALFALAITLSHAFSRGASGDLRGQLIVASNLSQANLLPLKMASELRSMPEVHAVSHASWFGGYYQEPKNPVPLLAVDAQAHFDANPDFRTDARELSEWKATANGLMIGRRLAQRFGITVGQRFNLGSYLWQHADGSAQWDFVVTGIYDVDESNANPSEGMFMHFDYLNAQRRFGKDQVNVIIVQLKDKAAARAVSERIDAMYANSEHETKTSSSSMLAENYLARILNVNQVLFPLVLLIVGSGFFIIATNVSNNMRHRLSEMAILKAIGFGRRQLIGVIFLETLLLFAAGALVGLLFLAAGLRLGAEALARYLPSLSMDARVWTYSAALALGLSMLASIAPVVQMCKVRLVEQLREQY